MVLKCVALGRMFEEKVALGRFFVCLFFVSLIFDLSFDSPASFFRFWHKNLKNKKVDYLRFFCTAFF